MMVSIAVQKLLSFMRSRLSVVRLNACTIGILFRMSFAVPISSSILPTLSSIIFKVLGLTLRFLIHLKLNFVLGVREICSFIVLHVTIQLEQHHLLTMHLFSRVYLWLLCLPNF